VAAACSLRERLAFGQSRDRRRSCFQVEGGQLPYGMGRSRGAVPAGVAPTAVALTVGATRDTALRAAAASVAALPSAPSLAAPSPTAALPTTPSAATVSPAVAPCVAATLCATAVSVAALSPVPLLFRPHVPSHARLASVTVPPPPPSPLPTPPSPSPPTPPPPTATPTTSTPRATPPDRPLPASPLAATGLPAALPISSPRAAALATEAAPRRGKPSGSLWATARAAGSRGAADAAAAATFAGVTSREAATTREAPAANEIARAGASSLEPELHRGVGAWTGSSAAPGRNRGAGFIQPVLSQVLHSTETTRATLKALCSERTIPFGDNDSDESLKTSLRRFNAAASTAWGADLQWLAVHERNQILVRRAGLSPSRAAVEHPRGVGVDQPKAPLASAQARDAPNVSLFPVAPSDGVPMPPRVLSTEASMRDGCNPSPSPITHRLDGHPPSPSRHHSSPTPLQTTPSADADGGGGRPGGRRSSALLAARMVQSLMEEEEEREKHMATSKQVAAVQGTVDQVISLLTNFSQSQATTNTQLDAALVQVANGQTAMFQAAEVMTASAGQGKRPSGSVIAEPPPKRGKPCGAVLPVSAGRTAGGGAASTEIWATVDLHSALVHDWTMPVEMLTATFVSQPLFEQLIELVKLCHVSVGKQGLFVSHACLKVYE